MSSLAQDARSVQPSRNRARTRRRLSVYHGDPPAPAEAAFEPSAADLAWWAQVPTADPADPRSDVAWLRDEARELYRRDDEAGRLAAGALRAAASGIEALGCGGAADYLAGQPAPPLAGDARDPRVSPLAAELDALAAWYRHLDAPAGDLAAWAVAWQAGECEAAKARSIVDLRLWRDEVWESILDGGDGDGRFDDRPAAW